MDLEWVELLENEVRSEHSLYISVWELETVVEQKKIMFMNGTGE